MNTPVIPAPASLTRPDPPVPVGADRRDILAVHGGLDAAWYLERYPDVADLGLEPEAHFLHLGHLMGRGISAQVPTLSKCPDLGAALRRRPRISYCIPVMDRLGDLKLTLAANLEANRNRAPKVEFIIRCHDGDARTADWLHHNFAEDLHSGYLRLCPAPPLPGGWHFGQAKGGFGPFMAGQIYSSLDGDNFVTEAETDQIIAAQDRFGAGFVFHHFSGVWGDGSSGRVSLPAGLYRRVGYDPRFLPRQFDEVDLILSALMAAPGAVLLRHDTPDHVLSSDNIRAFLRAVGRRPHQVTWSAPDRPAPAHPHAPDYLDHAPALAAMQAYNEAWCFLKNAPPGAALMRAPWIATLRQSARRCVQALDPDDLPGLLFDTPLPDLPDLGAGPVRITALTGTAPLPPAPAPGAPAWLVIDARPDPAPPGQIAPGLHVLHPRLGHPLSAAPLWEDGLERALAARGIARHRPAAG